MIPLSSSSDNMRWRTLGKVSNFNLFVVFGDDAFDIESRLVLSLDLSVQQGDYIDC